MPVFVSVGMDIGTSNSSAAVMTSSGPKVILIDGQSVMPSVIYKNIQGKMLVGKAAYDAVLTRPPNDGLGHTGFKIRMGHDDRYPFPSGEPFSPSQLTAQVIRRLWQGYLEAGHPNHRSCVITVPAIFRDPACKATLEAGQLAGLEFVTLLMEPVAAATAYGFTADDKHAKWLIFDIGGGTLDISLVTVRNGRLAIPNDGTAGNDLLGGRKFDMELMNYVLGPRKSDPDYKEKIKRYREMDPDYHPLRERYDLEDFSPQTNCQQWGMLMAAIEQAKIRLSDIEETIVETAHPLRDGKKKEFKPDFPLSRPTYERLIRPDVENAALICRQMLNRNKLRPSDIQCLVLVGGPSKTPFIQRVLSERLEIPLESSIDPMTVVAEGAALYAATVEVPEHLIPESPKKVANSAGIQVKLTYEGNSSEPVAIVSGIVTSASVPLKNLSLRINRTDGLWSSGPLSVDSSGFFTTEVLLIEAEKVRSDYETQILDQNSQVLLTLDEPKILFMNVIQPTLPSHLMVGVVGNMTSVLLDKGTDLPAEKTDEFETAERLSKGDSKCAVVIPVYESVEHFLGEVDLHQDCNLKIGELRIFASNIPHDLPAGARIDVTLRRDTNRQICVKAYVHLLGQEFKAVFDSKSVDWPLEEMEERLKALQSRLQRIERLQKSQPLPAVAEGLAALSRIQALEQICSKLQGAKDGDKDSQSRCHGDLVRLTGALNHLESLQTEARIRHRLFLLKPKVTGKAAEQLQSIKSDFEEALRTGNKILMAHLDMELLKLFYQVYLKHHTDLWLTLLRFPDRFQGSREQIDAYEQAVQVYKEIDQKVDNGEDISEENLLRCKQANEKLWNLWMTELNQWPIPDPFASNGVELEKPKGRKA
ncbi:MAG TPA: Hsp70 family protein [Anaerohalosphaeraceae bacterium]|nr:Hsp70 family protein [Anaerohalosphaeraceae bacterium]